MYEKMDSITPLVFARLFVAVHGKGTRAVDPRTTLAIGACVGTRSK